MYFVKKTPAEKRTDLQKKLKTGKLVRFPGAYNPLVAKLIEEIGYEGVYISGAVMANDLGIPDIGLTTLTEVSYRAEQIARVTSLPSIVDADTGFGEPMNCARTIETFEKVCVDNEIELPFFFDGKIESLIEYNKQIGVKMGFKVQIIFES